VSKGRPISLVHWNLFFNFFALALTIGFSPREAQAINLHALYTASCQREVGIVLDVSPRQVFLLNLRGDIVPVERFEIIYFATYPLDIVPMTAVNNPSLVPLVEIKTWQKGNLAPLVRGWPVDFSKDKIAFLSLRGSEVVIDRSSIWKVEFDKEAASAQFTARPQNRYEFAHPYAFSGCKVTETVAGNGRAVKVFPQQLISDPVAIKRELDRLVDGHAVVKRYEKDQQFYAVPEIYSNETSLGLWFSSANRYGASGNRKNNFTPLLENRVSDGPFRFQSYFATGSGPLLSSIHEENQTQAYYRMKADYFHFSAMVDPNLLLVGGKYKWFSSDLDNRDIRVVESAYVEFGFDYGRWALEFGVGGAANMGARSDDYFARQSLSIPRLGIRYQRPTWSLHLFRGHGESGGGDISVLRANMEFTSGKDQRYVLSLISKDALYSGESGAETHYANFKVEGKSQTAAAYAYFRFRTRYWFGISLAAEKLDVDSSVSTTTESKLKPKGATYLSLSF
jgi:hypothetical protein